MTSKCDTNNMSKEKTDSLSKSLESSTVLSRDFGIKN